MRPKFLNSNKEDKHIEVKILKKSTGEKIKNEIVQIENSPFAFSRQPRCNVIHLFMA